MEKIVIVNCRAMLPNSVVGTYPCNIFEPKEINEYLAEGYKIIDKDIVSPPESASNFSIIYRLSK